MITRTLLSNPTLTRHISNFRLVLLGKFRLARYILSMVRFKTFMFTISMAIVASLINPINSAAADCPDFKQFEKSSTTLVPYSYADFQKDLPSAIYPDNLRYSGYQIEIGEPVFRLKNMYPMFDPQFLKIISEKGPDAAVYYSEVKSSDGVNWTRLSRAHWDFLEDPDKNLLSSSFNPNAPIQSATSTLTGIQSFEALVPKSRLNCYIPADIA